MRLIHYSDRHITEVWDCTTQRVVAGLRGYKPDGLWVSVEGEHDWLSWCIDEEFGLDSLTHPTEVVLAPGANILHIEGIETLDAFHAKYAHVPEWAKGASYTVNVIDWQRISQEYDGIIIAPYIWEHRLSRPTGHWSDYMWYYTWDCASGCIWHPRAVAKLVPLEVQQIPKREDEQSVA